MFLPPPYPLKPPTVYVRPVASMAIRENHRHVGLDGQVYLPYLHEWRPQTHQLSELAVWMSSTFGSDPPCYAKPNRSSSVTSSNTASTNAEEQRRRIEKEIAEANLVAETARKAAAEEAHAEREARQLKLQHDTQLSSMRAMVISKAQFRIRQLFDETKVELRRDLKDQKVLENGKEQIEQLLKEGEERKAALVKENIEMDDAIQSLKEWISAVQEHKRSYEQETSIDTDAQKVDLLTIPTDIHSAQMLALSAESAAIDDCIYFLDRALVKGSIGLNVFLKEVRKLSKRQFMAKVRWYGLNLIDHQCT